MSHVRWRHWSPNQFILKSKSNICGKSQEFPFRGSWDIVFMGMERRHRQGDDLKTPCLQLLLLPGWSNETKQSIVSNCWHILPFDYTSVSKLSLGSSITHFTAPYLHDTCVCVGVGCLSKCMFVCQGVWERDRYLMKTRERGGAGWKRWTVRPLYAPLSACSLRHVPGLVNCSATWLLCQSS